MAALTVSIHGDNSHLAKSLRGAEGAVSKFAGNISLKLKDVFKANIYQGLLNMAAKAIGSPGAGIKNAFDDGGRLSDLHSRTGVAVKDLAILEQAFKDNGMAASNVGPMINRLQKSLAGFNEEGQDTKSIFARLGLDPAKLKHMNSAKDQLAALQKAIGNIEDPAERTAAAMAIFGKSGGEMLTFFADKGALASAAENLGSQTDILERNAGMFDRISDIIGASGNKMKGFFVGVADSIGPVLLPLLEKFNKLDFAKWGQQIGNAIALVAQAFSDGAISEMFGIALKIGAMKGLNFLDRGFRGVMNILPELLSLSVQAMAEDLKLLMSPEFWSGLVNVLGGAAMKFGAYMLDAIRRPLVLLQSGIEWVFQQMFAKLSKIPGMSKILGGDFSNPESLDQITQRNMADGPTFFGQSSKDLHARGDAAMAQGGTDLMPLIQERLRMAKAKLAQLAGGFAAGFSGGPDAFDPSGEQSKLSAVIARLQAKVDANKADALANFGAKDGSEGELATKAGGGKDKGIIASSLAKIGGGGNFAGGTMGLQREANSLLKKIVANTSLKTGGLKTGGLQTGPLNAVFA